MTPPVPEKRPVATLVARPNRLDYRALLWRAVFFISVIGSLALVWWNLQRLTPLQVESSKLNTTVTRLSTEIEEMNSKWTKPEIEQVLRKYGEVQGQLFSGQSALESWLQNLRQAVIPMALDVKAEFGKTGTQSAGDRKLAIIPATVSVEVQPALGIEGVQSPYQRVLRLSQNLTEQEKRADLMELTIVGR